MQEISINTFGIWQRNSGVEHCNHGPIRCSTLYLAIISFAGRHSFLIIERLVPHYGPTSTPHLQFCSSISYDSNSIEFVKATRIIDNEKVSCPINNKTSSLSPVN